MEFKANGLVLGMLTLLCAACGSGSGQDASEPAKPPVTVTPPTDHIQPTPLKVTTTSPANGAVDVDAISTIEVTFNREVNESELDDLNIAIYRKNLFDNSLINYGIHQLDGHYFNTPVGTAVYQPYSIRTTDDSTTIAIDLASYYSIHNRFDNNHHEYSVRLDGQEVSSFKTVKNYLVRAREAAVVKYSFEYTDDSSLSKKVKASEFLGLSENETYEYQYDSGRLSQINACTSRAQSSENVFWTTKTDFEHDSAGRIVKETVYFLPESEESCQEGRQGARTVSISTREYLPNNVIRITEHNSEGEDGIWGTADDYVRTITEAKLNDLGQFVYRSYISSGSEKIFHQINTYTYNEQHVMIGEDIYTFSRSKAAYPIAKPIDNVNEHTIDKNHYTSFRFVLDGLNVTTLEEYAVEYDSVAGKIIKSLLHKDAYQFDNFNRLESFRDNIFEDGTYFDETRFELDERNLRTRVNDYSENDDVRFIREYDNILN